MRLVLTAQLLLITYFLIRREKDESYFSSGTSLSRGGVKLLVKNVNSSDNSGAPKTTFFNECVSEGRVPTQEDILSELVLVVSGLEAPEGGDDSSNRRS